MGPGFFGKLPSHGDFVARRMAPAMQAPFDAWLQAGLVRSQADLGASWQSIWLSSPLWRFALAPGVCGPQAWTGVMMPSADRVGRCFPLVLATALADAPSLRDCLTAHAAWFMQLEDLALSALDTGFSVETFDTALQALGGAPRAHAGSVARGHDQVALRGAGALPHLADVDLHGGSAWWTEGSERVAPCVAVCQAMPPAARFAALLDGRWAERGWPGA